MLTQVRAHWKAAVGIIAAVVAADGGGIRHQQPGDEDVHGGCPSWS